MANNEPIGSVLVLGGGIAGMQSALDLAGGGYLVHMVTDEPSIGGKMAQLDKTFPTNECSMCLLGPKMSDCLSHPNIIIHTNSRLENLAGEAGRFTARVRKNARYVDIDECTACGDCAEACPVEVKDRFNQGMGTRKAVYKLFPQSVPNRYMIDKRGTPPCRQTCPAGTNVQGYVALVSQGKFAEALEVIHRRLPFAGICGRICHHPCEAECNRGEIDEPLAIATIKRAAADYGWDDFAATETPALVPTRKERVAIVGGGPAGMTAAYDLVAKGYQVTIFEALPSPGGWLKYGIPRYRLPEEIVQREIDNLLKHGIEVRTNTRVGTDITMEEIKSRYDAVLVAAGVQKSRDLPVEGARLSGVLPGVGFLRDIKLGLDPRVGKKVVVIGGGNVAMDVARSALRQGGAEVHVACLESRDEMPAHAWEIEEAEEEGVVLHPGWGPKRIAGGGAERVSAVEFRACTAVFDTDKRFNPRYDETRTMVLDADTVIMAVGQAADLEFLRGQDAVVTARGIIAADPVTKATGDARIFACGDVAHGPASVIEAVASAHEAAESIDRYLNGLPVEAGREKPSRDNLGRPEDTPVHPAARHPQRFASAPDRAGDYREVALGMTREEAMAEAERCLNCGVCSECLQCEKACKKQVIRHADADKALELPVGAVVLAPGFDIYDAKLKGEYGYGEYQNVISSLEFERLLSSTGPTTGHILRPSDHIAPKKVAFIQCVGSRECADGGAEYCSSICCMYSTKEALIAREHDAGIEPTIFYLDMRSYGKNFDKYVEAARQGGVRYVRAMISAVKEDPVTNNLFIKYIDEAGEIVAEEFDLVVLAVGVLPPKQAAELMAIVGIEANPYGFAATAPFSPTETTRAGIYVAGAFQGPRDIPETVVNASAAAAKAGELLAAARNTLTREKVYPPEREVSGQEPRIGVFICQCGINIASVVNVPEVVAYAQKLPGVIHCQDNLYTCSQDTLKRMKEIIEEKQLNRVVVASCTMRTHQPLFREMMREAGLNQFYFEMANIRDQCSWVHRGEPENATEKAKDLARMAVAKVRHHEPLHLHSVPVEHSLLVIGGGVAGMTAALTAARQGFAACIVEKGAELGGHAREVMLDFAGNDVQACLRQLAADVGSHPLVRVHTGCEVVNFSGHAGQFSTTIRNSRSGAETKIDHGALIVATGVREQPPVGYLYGEDPRVVTTTAFEKMVAAGQPLAAERIVMIQCAGSRTDELKYCSRTCCGQALKNAVALKERQPDTDIYILYRDIRTYGFMEKLYKEARAKGIRFVLYTPDRRPVVTRDGDGLRCDFYEPSLKTVISVNPGLVVLAPGTVPSDTSRSLGMLLKVPVNEDGFFVETHAKLGPIDFPSQGIYLCGGAHSPKSVDEAICQAQGAAARAATILTQDNLMAGGVVASVDQEKCAACLTCVRVCPYSVPRIDASGKAYIEPVQCHGCGSCAGECPNKAIELQHYKDHQVLEKIRGLFREESP
ncbi:FAD-dependent oxidoreductase [Anaeroselena agilis]|uniref:FAD-dependent oxidoreductase n=1 Tax=Anaeroselena agilis TaxID=3063788 RepID=A0ABU3P0J7_9FIRM|nr:FAD-dependent oxidoreductase [Selenomonadales bacterium 4137-cl]